MKANLYIDADGMEQLALGKPLYPWHISCRIIGEDGSAMYPPPEKSFQIAANVRLNMPPRDVCVNNAQNKLNEKLTEIRANAYAEERTIQQRLNDLLMIGHDADVKPAAPTTTVNQDIF